MPFSPKCTVHFRWSFIFSTYGLYFLPGGNCAPFEEVEVPVFNSADVYPPKMPLGGFGVVRDGCAGYPGTGNPTETVITSFDFSVNYPFDWTLKPHKLEVSDILLTKCVWRMWMLRVLHGGREIITVGLPHLKMEVPVSNSADIYPKSAPWRIFKDFEDLGWLGLINLE